MYQLTVKQCRVQHSVAADSVKVNMGGCRYDRVGQNREPVNNKAEPRLGMSLSALLAHYVP